MSELAPGDRAPDFALPDDEGRVVKLSGLRGRWVVVTFYAEDDTPVCSKQVCSFRDSFAAFDEADAVVLAISSDPVDSHRRWRARAKLPFALLSDAENKVASRYGAHGEKLMYGRKVMGVIRTTVIVDPKGRIASLQRRVRTEGHAGRVLEELRRAQVSYL
jgi:thioredoxin-dependent peroxiredoxin